MQIRVKEDPKEFGRCGCGRSPTGYCVGFHGLSEEDWAEGKTQLIHNLMSGHGKVVEDKPDSESDNFGKENK